jgi:hypothetical protein
VDDHSEARAVERGVQAEKLLNHPLLIEAFDAVKAALRTAWENSPARDSEGREELFRRIKATNDARGYLDQAIRDGKVAVHNREERRLFGLIKR